MKTTLLLTTSALALLTAAMPVADSRPIASDVVASCAFHDAGAIAGDDGIDEFGDDDFYDEDGTLTDNPDRADRDDIGEQGEYRDGEYGERDDAGWNRPPTDYADESGELLEGLGEGGDPVDPPPNSGSPLVNGLGQGSSSGGLLD